MLSARLSGRLDKLLDWAVRLVAREREIAPNILTIVGLAISLAAAASFALGLWRLRLGGVLILAAGLFDMLDGAVARVSGSETQFGAFLDSVLDRYSDIGILIGLIVFYSLEDQTTNLILSCTVLAGSLLTSYTRARAESLISRKCNVGLVERPERIILLAAGAISDYMPVALWALAFLTNVTALQRIHFTWRETRNSKLSGKS
jgi:CDP-diacylglycerol--glycerol-3-phosphate 3-phosphatidyltransferase